MEPHPVLLLGMPSRIVLAAARSLWRHGIPVIATAIREKDRQIHTRAIRRFIRLPDHEAHPGAFRMELLRLIEAEGVEVVIPISDSALEIAASLHDEISALAHLAAPREGELHAMADKTETALLAERLGIPTPVTLSIAGADPVRSARNLPYPVIAKARLATSRQLGGPRVYADANTLTGDLSFYPELADLCIFQRFHPGEDVYLGLIAERGAIRVAHQSHALLTSQPFGGLSLIIESQAIDPRLFDFASAFVRELEWHGVLQLDFRRNPDTGEIRFLEGNPRLWGSCQNAISCGVDFPHFVWRQARGEKIESLTHYPVGVRTGRMDWVLRRMGRIVLKRESTPPAETLWAVLRSCWPPGWALRGVGADPWPETSAVSHRIFRFLLNRLLGRGPQEPLRHPARFAPRSGSPDPV